ncbi:2OG-Fe(II) oxygenase [Shewanella avicenniae]|uniref:2OG-Fe(II) oxygenase n=1 Tax=Shewanella avicenniae TaxID=2814294 RepID=A0ABX7QX87_9GAMM|nr:2OG-Fe(II) oxygenase [Shewanella avicenniae]QSX35443.1 2OG-Fe(II) oxygenase [Shewanella avicenniae]
MDFIEVFPNAISDALCERIITIFDQHPQVRQGRTGLGVDEAKKLSTDITLDRHQDLLPLRDEILAQTFSAICDYFDKYSLALMGAVAMQVSDENGHIVTLSLDNYQRFGHPRAASLVKYLYRSGELNIQKYPKGKGGYPHWHSEQYPQLPDNEALHRVVLFMVYLNDVTEGGETEFYYQKKKLIPKRGTLVIAPAGFTHSHRGNVPISDDKYIVTSWIMFNRAEQLYRR